MRRAASSERQPYGTTPGLPGGFIKSQMCYLPFVLLFLYNYVVVDRDAHCCQCRWWTTYSRTLDGLRAHVKKTVPQLRAQEPGVNLRLPYRSFAVSSFCDVFCPLNVSFPRLGGLPPDVTCRFPQNRLLRYSSRAEYLLGVVLRPMVTC